MKRSVILGVAVLLATLTLPLGALGQQNGDLVAMDYFSRGADKQVNGDLDGAIALFSKAIERNPNDALAYNARGIAKYGKKDWDGAIADFSKTIELNSKNTNHIYSLRGVAKQKKGDWDGAIADLTKAIELDPKDEAAYYNRGYAKKAKGDQAGADADFAQADKLLPPHHPDACAETNQFFGLPDDELTVTVNGKEVTGAEKKARLQEMCKLPNLPNLLELPQSDLRLKSVLRLLGQKRVSPSLSLRCRKVPPRRRDLRKEM